MRYIEKGAAPPGLVRWRTSTPGVSYGDLQSPEKDEVRSLLCTEQGHLCAYCQQRITPAGDKMRIEHWIPRQTDPTLSLEWSNLLGVCPGVGEEEATGHGVPARHRSPTRRDHCDRVRGHRPLHVNPTEGPRIGDLFRYDGAGTITADDDGASQDIETLNLNQWRLKQNRKQVLERLRKQLGDHGPWPLGDLQRLLRYWETPSAGKLFEYAGVACYYLRRSIRKRTSR